MHPIEFCAFLRNDHCRSPSHEALANGPLDDWYAIYESGWGNWVSLWEWRNQP